MAFDSKRFLKEKFEARTESVPVPALSAWFADGDVPEWKVRGMTGVEMARVQEVSASTRKLEDLAKALAAAAGSGEKIAGILQAAGLPANLKDQPDAFIKHLEIVVTGSVEPAVDLPLAIKLAETFPVEFHQLATKIIVLTGMGHEPGKSKPSGKAPT